MIIVYKSTMSDEIVCTWYNSQIEANEIKLADLHDDSTVFDMGAPVGRPDSKVLAPIICEYIINCEMCGCKYLQCDHQSKIPTEYNFIVFDTVAKECELIQASSDEFVRIFSIKKD
jgi:hypothetical protein